MWTSGMVDVLDANCSVGWSQIVPSGSHAQWDPSLWDGSGNSCNLLRLLKATGPRKLSACKMVKESDGSPIHSQELNSEHWAENFLGQFSWYISTAGLLSVPTSESVSRYRSPIGNKGNQCERFSEKELESWARGAVSVLLQGLTRNDRW